jgi:hypothetical protein
MSTIPPNLPAKGQPNLPTVSSEKAPAPKTPLEHRVDQSKTVSEGKMRYENKGKAFKANEKPVGKLVASNTVRKRFLQQNSSFVQSTANRRLKSVVTTASRKLSPGRCTLNPSFKGTDKAKKLMKH